MLSSFLLMKKELLFIIIAIIIIFFISFFYCLKPVSQDTQLKEIEVKKGDSYLSLGLVLKENNLIRSPFFYKLYVKMLNVNKLEACTYRLSENMGVIAIIKELNKKCDVNPDTIKITFQEGIHMRKIASLITKYTNNNNDDLDNLLNDEEYLDELINKYWFLTEKIKNPNLYYSLEGYLFPNTYQFLNRDVSVKDIIEVMLTEMEKQLEPYKEEIQETNLSVHEILTFASIVELESACSDDRAGIAGVFYNRLNSNWPLGSDVTTYYAIKVDMGERDLYLSELNDFNDYNTRSTKMVGLPIGPICNPGLDSIIATLKPTKHSFYYFAADKNKKTYFTKTSVEHEKKVEELKKKGLWYVH